jgi:hypothetical protein
VDGNGAHNLKLAKQLVDRRIARASITHIFSFEPRVNLRGNDCIS